MQEIKIWEKDFVTVSSVIPDDHNGYFKAEVFGGIELETILAVCYSYPNGSLESHETDALKYIEVAVASQWGQTVKPEFVDESFLPVLYQLVVVANKAYNAWLFGGGSHA